MKRLFIIPLLCLLALSAAAKKPKQQPLSIEREQQFTYYWYAAKYNLDNQHYPEALMMLHFCEELNPDDALTREYLGTIYAVLRQPDRALDYFRLAYTLDPANCWYRYNVALYRLNTPESRKEALQVMEKVVRLCPDDPDAWATLHDAAMINEKYRRALQAQDRVDQLQGYDEESAFNRYRIYIFEYHFDKALDELDRYLERNPYNVRFLLYKAELLEVFSKVTPVDALVETYTRILALDPNNLTVLNNYAYLIATHGGDLRQAEQMSLQTIREQPDNPVFLDTYAWILHLQGQDTLAAFYIRKALQNATEKEIEEVQQHYREIIK